MAKLTILALAFAALVAFASAHTTIVTTTIEDENPISGQQQCSRQLQGQSFNQCQMYLQQGQTPYDNPQQQQGLQQCCQELKNVNEQCQCEAVKQVFRQAQQQQQQQGQQGGRYGGSQQTSQLKQMAQNLPNQCNLQTKQCQIGTVMTTTTITETTTDNPLPWPLPWPFGTGSDSQQCSRSEIQRPVNQCQRYVSQQIRSPRTIVMSVHQGQQQEGLQECCVELQNLKKQCQCEALKELAKQTMQQQQQQGSRQYGGQQGQTEIVRRVIQNLPNQCYLDIQQCNIPYTMF